MGEDMDIPSLPLDGADLTYPLHLNYHDNRKWKKFDSDEEY